LFYTIHIFQRLAQRMKMVETVVNSTKQSVDEIKEIIVKEICCEILIYIYIYIYIYISPIV